MKEKMARTDAELIRWIMEGSDTPEQVQYLISMQAVNAKRRDRLRESFREQEESVGYKERAGNRAYLFMYFRCSMRGENGSAFFELIASGGKWENAIRFKNLEDSRKEYLLGLYPEYLKKSEEYCEMLRPAGEGQTS